MLAANTAPALAADQAVCTRTSYLLGENLTFNRKDIVQYADVQNGAQGANGEAAQTDPVIEFTADQLDYDSNADVVTATGNVLLVRAEQSLVADSVTWDRKSGEVRANGAVQIIDEEGNKLYGDSIELTETIRDGVIENILVVLDAGGRMVATRGTRDDGVITLENAAYSACLVETTTGRPKNPSWQLRAIKVVYNPADKRVRYDGARLELFGLPVIPMPGLSHPVGEGSGGGLLLPDIRLSRANGMQLSVPYYFNIAPNRDLTVTGSVFTQVLPMVSANYRALTDRGAYQITGYATASSRIPVSAGGIGADSQDDFRGYLDAVGRFQLTEAWTVSGSLRVATDRTFLRRYDITREDRLRSTIEAERIGPNSYFSLAGWATQTLRVNDPQGQVPIALPVVDWRLRLPDSIAGGKVEFQVNTLAITRTAGQDTQRAFAQARWDMRRLTGMGQEFTLTALARGDVYNSSENALTNTLIYRGESGLQARASGSVAADVRWPFVGEAFGGTQVISPRVQVVGTPTTGNLALPNEDSRAIELEDSNLFALNRLPGYDRVEEGVRVVYGVEWSLQRPGMQLNAVVGQSYRFDDQRDFLPAGTGLGNRTSDVVGRVDLKLRNFIRYTHRFRLDKDNLAVRRNEVDITLGGRQTYVQVGYLRLNRDIGPEVEDLQDREELRVAGRVRVARYWSVFGAGVVDLSNAKEDPRLQSDGFEPIRTRLGVAYEDDCLELGLTWRRDFIPVGDAQRGNTFLLRVALRNLGF
ncbi:LPS-assembly protein LptD [Blastomonas aquatica]|uniref:LPS-assembly protein LptD n=1 Tax=Blastomonas aquatica TaxID=1510276 RepID=A0ABQ1J6K0_9SPHN|nr:LPS-assembly protein LptD [Blastomonas aquatica]